MRSFDPRTIDRAAEVICDRGGDNERPGWQLERLLRDAGWTDPPPYDGSPKVSWLSDTLRERADRPEDIARVFCRACDRLEYDGSRPVAEAFRAALNGVLEPEKIAVIEVAGRPVLGEIGAGLTSIPVFGRPDDLETRLARLLDDPAMIALLVDRAEQSHLAQQSGAHLLALFGIGSLVEGLLLAVLLHRDPKLVMRRGNGTVPADRAGLDLLLDIAHTRGHIQLDAKAFMTPVRNFRNYIHPRRQAAEAFTPDHETVSLSWGPVHAVLNDLEQSATA